LLGNGEPPALLARGREFGLYAVGIVAVGVMWLLIQYQSVVGVPEIGRFTMLGVRYDLF